MKATRFIIIFTFLLASAGYVSAQNVSGKYEGTADVQPFGKLLIKAEIRQSEEKISGAFETPLGAATIVEGSFIGGNLKLTIVQRKICRRKTCRRSQRRNRQRHF